MLILHAGQVGAWRPSGRAGLDPSPGHRMPRGHSRRPISCTPHPSDPRGLTRIPGTCGCHPDISPHAPLPARPLHLQTAPGSLLFSPPPPGQSLCLSDAPRGLLAGAPGPSLALPSLYPRAAAEGSLRGPFRPASPPGLSVASLALRVKFRLRAGPASSFQHRPCQKRHHGASGARSLGTAEAGGAGPGTQRHWTAGRGDPEWPSTGGHGRGRGKPRDEGCRGRPGGPLEEVTQGQARDRGGEGRLPQVGGVVGRVPGRVESHWLTHLCRRKLP